jgi:hypothetical protein
VERVPLVGEIDSLRYLETPSLTVLRTVMVQALERVQIIHGGFAFFLLPFIDTVVTDVMSPISILSVWI